MRALLITLLFLLAHGFPSMTSANPSHSGFQPPVPPPRTLRVASFNTSLFSDEAGGLIRQLQNDSVQARKIAAVIQRQRPDLLLLNEFDFDTDAQAAELFQTRYLEVAQDGQAPIRYDYRYLAPVNTGVPSGLDLDRNGQVGGEGRLRGNDAWGYGLHPGQYGMLVLSRYPIDTAAVRTFQNLRWATLPDASAPIDPVNAQPWYTPEAWTQLRLSSKSHWDIPVDTPLGRIHLLAAHPTPPSFDGPERRNAHRNFDEIRLWAEYLSGTEQPWLCDDSGHCGGLPADAQFVIVGDYNADPVDGSSLPGAIAQLLNHPRVQANPAPRSEGALAAPRLGTNASQRGAAEFDTAQFSEHVGNLRVDYALPSTGLTLVSNGVFWPRPDEPGYPWLDATDHRMVWVDLAN